MTALNTMVNGSSGTCVAAADWLSSVYGAAHDAEGSAQSAETTAEHGWDGPAQEEFAYTVHGVPGRLGDLAARAYQGEWALREFAASLDGVVETMNQAQGKARAGELRMDGPFILAPEQPLGVASLPSKALHTRRCQGGGTALPR